jgi:hypothetical protein
MAGLGWGKRDESTKEERADWKARAKAQMDAQNGRDTDNTDDDSPGNPRHARRSR